MCYSLVCVCVLHYDVYVTVWHVLQYHVLQLEVTYQCKADALLQRERHAIERLQKQQEVGRTGLSLMSTCVQSIYKCM